MNICYVVEGKNTNQVFTSKRLALLAAKNRPWADGTVYLHPCPAKAYDGRSRSDGLLVHGDMLNNNSLGVDDEN